MLYFSNSELGMFIFKELDLLRKHKQNTKKRQKRRLSINPLGISSWLSVLSPQLSLDKLIKSHGFQILSI